MQRVFLCCDSIKLEMLESIAGLESPNLISLSNLFPHLFNTLVTSAGDAVKDVQSKATRKGYLAKQMM